MEFQPVTIEQKDSMLDAVQDASRVSGYAVRFLRRVAEIYEEHQFERDWGVKIALAEDNLTATFSSIFGLGKGTLKLRSGDEGIFGLYVIEKRFENATGQSEWRAVWALRVTKDGQIYPGGGIGESVSARVQLMHRDDDRDAYEVARSIFYRLGADE
ncbi:hypothetical protein FHW68_000632 [Pseudomonas sp. Tn43]|uniref:hypothetical protein n=1 Tax=Pseudomonas sp. Tn43 TaxID=701213 RepID=UPI001612F0ED|nr:hypothetical protein [Pseudomonas sp. Tn43]MBB3239160.1 hypothetical protein [Pseudomonas sp. Tn43]